MRAYLLDEGILLTEKVFVDNQKVFMVDNVLHTGQTLQTCEKIIGHQLIPLVYGISMV